MTHLIPRREDSWFPLQKEFDRVFDEFFSPKRLPSLLNGVKSRSGYPKLDILVTDGKYRIEAAVPGVNPDDVTVELLPSESGQRCVRISGKMCHDYQYANDTDYHYRELTRAKFQRVVALPDEVKGDPEACIKNGMLTLTWELPKKIDPTKEVRAIEVKRVD